jgi:hypothetical protein
VSRRVNHAIASECTSRSVQTNNTGVSVALDVGWPFAVTTALPSGTLSSKPCQRVGRRRRTRAAMPQCVRLEGAKGCSTRHEKCEEGLLMLREAPAGFANHKRIRKMLVGAVGIENNGRRDFKDLRGMRRNTKSLKRNDGERKGTRIAPLMLPRSCRSPNSLGCGFTYRAEQESRLRAQIWRRGWQADNNS